MKKKSNDKASRSHLQPKQVKTGDEDATDKNESEEKKKDEKQNKAGAAIGKI